MKDAKKDEAVKKAYRYLAGLHEVKLQTALSGCIKFNRHVWQQQQEHGTSASIIWLNLINKQMTQGEVWSIVTKLLF